jgi:hypothetical protein
MSLDLDRLEKPRLRGGRLIARCPACAEIGVDRSCDHLFIADEGRGPFGCVVNPGPGGDAHRKRIFELVGVQEKPGRFRPSPVPCCTPATPKPAPRIPVLRPLTVGEMTAVATLRGWPVFAGLELLTRRGLLWQGDVFDDGQTWPAWIVTDSTLRNAQARRIDGQPWQGIGNAKAKTLPGCDPSWPIGTAGIGNRPFVLLCEGQPDFCASLMVAWFEGLPVESVAPVCMTGAGNSIHADALPVFAGKHVRVAVHGDDAGRKAGKHWAQQLYGAGAACVDWFDFSGLVRRDGQPVKDLADFATQLDLDCLPVANMFGDQFGNFPTIDAA